jgi:hypothetical protein
MKGQVPTEHDQQRAQENQKPQEESGLHTAYHKNCEQAYQNRNQQVCMRLMLNCRPVPYENH